MRSGEADRAVLVCGTGAGALMAANKIAGIRCGLGRDVYSAHQAVEHDDANAIAVDAWLIGPATAGAVIEAFLGATFGKAAGAPAVAATGGGYRGSTA
ncbi:RpiB/LacA/LacB family sugar-phosphate isomerase [Streptomyces niveus]|uniref:RpiB/LacA/LacB family sugar-phosphate isomerase n=1 Tax=Streptomyces niveus TaxID=193462 RepID=UPI0036D218C8